MNDLSVFGLHFKWSMLRFAAPVLAALAAVIAVASAPDRVITSPEISAVLLRTVAILAPVLAALAAWDGLRERRGGGGFLLDNAPRPGGQAALIQAAAGVVWTALVWALPLLCLIGYSWLLRSLTDLPQLLNLAIIAVLVAWLTVLGYLLGFLIRHWLAVLAAALIPAALYGVAVFPALGDLLTAINPFVDRSGYEFYTPEPAYLAGVLLCLLGVVAVTLALFMVLSRPVRWTSALAGVTGLVLVMGGGGVVAAHDGRWATAVDVTDRLVPLSSASLTLNVLPPVGHTEGRTSRSLEPGSDDLRGHPARVQGTRPGHRQPRGERGRFRALVPHLSWRRRRREHRGIPHRRGPTRGTRAVPVPYRGQRLGSAFMLAPRT